MQFTLHPRSTRALQPHLQPPQGMPCYPYIIAVAFNTCQGIEVSGGGGEPITNSGGNNEACGGEGRSNTRLLPDDVRTRTKREATTEHHQA